jgi:N-alpha-acetyl-L-2,4-diaminobutyrate deacetylase
MPDDATTTSAADMTWTPAERSAVPCTIDLDGVGRSVGHFAVPWSRDESGWGNLMTPIAVIANGDGPTILLTGGNHGDEFEGPVALRRLIHELDPSVVSGRVIVVPGLNQAALKVGRRLSPIDGGNLNRSFPGNPIGTPTERVADFVQRELVTRADIVLDFHSGGESMVFHPMVATHDLRDPAQAAATAEFVKVFGTPLAVIADEPDPVGLLDQSVESLGKIFLTTEIRGGRAISAQTVDIAARGVLNTLRQAGVVPGDPEYDAPPDFVRMVEHGSALAPSGGLFEPLVDPGDVVASDDEVARIHALDELSTPPVTVRAPIGGLVLLRHNPGLIAAGDPAVAIAIAETPPWATSTGSRRPDRADHPEPDRAVADDPTTTSPPTIPTTRRESP